MGQGRIILHIDMNSFYASVEMAYNPSLKGKPLAIAGSVEDRRGIVVTSSYEARARGVRTTMPVWQAKRACPELIIMAPNFDRYRAASRKLFALLQEYTPLVEPVSIDEGYVDVTSSTSKKHPIDLAKEIQSRLLKEMDLPCSIGIAPNKFLAKMASDMKKPLGITVLRKRDIPNILWPMEIGEMHGIGKRSVQKFHKYSIKTIGDLAKADIHLLSQAFGINGKRLRRLANGEDNRPVDPDSIHHFKSVGHSTTLKEDTVNMQTIQQHLVRLSEAVNLRMRRKKVFARGVQLTIRYHDRKTITRSRKVENPLQFKDDFYHEALALLHKHWNGEPIRLLGITGYDLIEEQHAYKQLDLFQYEQEIKKDRLSKAVEELKSRFGEKAVIKGNDLFLRQEKGTHATRGTSLQRDFLVNDEDEIINPF
ncbi:DNA polymerase IV [Halalkalibacterium ligniniphilum]|uniref:DNA polymerase IV n=1 Tax=Halalkalibacterium ligniniphilum TaxID=1134413 RepID=UPI00034C52AD|nr:DNA polymerase IV [Halalkalibacterium ligniniphilum]